jgi:hypothetical protein
MAVNFHTDEALDAFAVEIMQMLRDQREEVLNRIETFHAPNCTSAEKDKEFCLKQFNFIFLAFVEQKLLQADLAEELLDEV